MPQGSLSLRITRGIATYTAAGLAFAALSVVSMPSFATAYCANTVVGIQGALNLANNNPGDDEVRIVTGHYALPGVVTRLGYATANAGGLRISGGWNGDCSAQSWRADATVLDGQNQVGILNITYQNTTAPNTRFEVANLTLANGTGSTYAGGNGLNVLSTAPGQTDLRLDNLILRGHSGYFGGAASINLTRGTLTISNSLFAANQAPTSAYGHLDTSVQASNDLVAIRFANNTFVDGDCLGNTGGIRGCSVGARLGEGLRLDAVNNLFWHNKLSDLDITASASNASARLDSNRIDLVQGSVIPTLSRPVTGDPEFVLPGSGDYRLKPGSLMVDRGAGRIDGLTLPERDLDNLPRLAFGELDLGAFETALGTHIFGNGFD